MSSRTIPIIMVSILVLSCSGDSGSKDAAQDEAASTGSAIMSEGPPEVSGDVVETASGLRYIIIKEGEGPEPQQGQTVSVHYTGWLTTGSKFDSSVVRGQPLPFPIGTGRVIRGWDEGVMMMRVGEKRRLIIPPSLGYGERGSPPAIPGGSTLIFDVELLGIVEQ